MSDVLLTLVGVTAAVVATSTAVILLLRWHLGRRNRVHPKVRSPAPLHWLVSPTAPARMHRRLQTTVRVASVHERREVPIAVAEQAVELDRRVVLAARHPGRARSSALRELRLELDELDRLAMACTRRLDAGAVGDPLDRLTALADARAEVDALDHSLR